MSEEMDDLHARLCGADERLYELYEAATGDAKARLGGKLEGIRLAIDYVRGYRNA